jgi:hypothetical protein
LGRACERMWYDTRVTWTERGLGAAREYRTTPINCRISALVSNRGPWVFTYTPAWPPGDAGDTKGVGTEVG